MLNAFALAAGSGRRGLVLAGLRGREARIAAVLAGGLLHEDRHQHLEQHQQGLEQRAGFRRHLVRCGQLLELRLQPVELLTQGVLVHRGHVRRSLNLRLRNHHRRQHRQTLRPRHRRVALAPTRRLALDALPVGEVPARVAGPMHPVRDEVEPQLLGAHTALVHHLPAHTAPAGKVRVVQRRGVARQHDLTRQRLEQFQQFNMVRLLVVEAVAALTGAGVQQVRRVAVDQLRTPIVVLGQKPVRAAVNALHRVVALELGECPRVPVDADVA